MASKMRMSNAVVADGEEIRPLGGNEGLSEPGSEATEKAIPPRSEPAHAATAHRAAATPSDEPARATHQRASTMIAYWSLLRGERSLPAKNEIDPEHIASRWPNSILMRRRPGSQSLEAVRVYDGEAASAPRLGATGARDGVSLSPLMLQWLLALAKEVMREARPMTDEDSFPGVAATVRYRAVGLPFSDDGKTVDHVVCYVAAED